jgi:hypothetical protein
MGRTACTEPQCLYKGALYLTVELYLYTPYGPYGVYRASVSVQGCTLLWTNHGGQREPDRSKSRWIDGVDEDAGKLGGINCLAAAQGRGRWRHLLVEAKAH